MTGQSASSSPLALPQKYRATPKQPEDSDQAIVHTPYGRGLVTRTRKDDAIKEIQLLEWESLVKPTSGTKRQTPFMMYTAVDYPSVIPRIGDDVICQYGRGRVTNMSRVTTTTDTTIDAETKKDPTTTKPAIKIKYTIALSSWRLNGRSDVTCNVIHPPPRVVRKHTLSEMDAHEKVSLAKTQKAKATTFFSQKKDYDLALSTYASAVDAVRNVQHDHTSTNTVRADLVVVMVTCSNNAATCCIKLQKYDEASKFAKNALILLDALYGKRGKKIHTILKSEGSIDAKLFGEWRIKSYLIVARSCIETNEIVDAMAVLKKARGVATSYIDELNASIQQHQSRQSKEEKASFKSLTIQMKEIRRLLVECSDKKKAAKKTEKRRAKAMFGGGGSSSKEEDGDKENASPAETNANNKDLEQQQSDKKESSATTKNANTANTPDTVEDEVRHTKSETKQPPPFKRKSSLNGNKDGRPGPRKSVSFSNRPPQIKEIESANSEDGEDAPWYSEHQEALIMLAVAGLSAVALMALRRSAR